MSVTWLVARLDKYFSYLDESDVKRRYLSYTLS